MPASPVMVLNNLGNRGATFRGFEDDAYSGFSVSRAGDVNGDGFADVIMGAYRTNADGTDRGTIFVVFGSSSLSNTSLNFSSLGTRGFTIRGFEDDAFAGYSVSGAGDVNGDGFADIIVGAPNTNAGGTDRGEAYVVFGGAGLTSTTLTLSNLGTRGFTLRGFEDSAYAGRAVSGAGDINGDGFSDIILGAPNTNAGGANRGEGYVVFGGNSLANTTLTLSDLGTRGFTLSGFEDLASAGRSVSGAGDVNGDGFSDVILGAPFTDAGGADPGQSYVIFGGNSLANTTLTLNNLGTRGFTLHGFDDLATSGTSVSGAGDVDGDGFSDLIIGAPGGQGRGAYVVLGGNSLANLTLTLGQMGTRGITIRGFENFAMAGSSVSGAGDVNGDGYADLLVGAYGTDAGGFARGEAYLIFGGPRLSGTAITLNALGNRGVTFRGFEDSAFTGRSVSGAGDVNGDGFADIIVGAHLANAGGSDRGEVYLILQPPQPPVTAIGTDSGTVATVRVVDGSSGFDRARLQPFGTAFTGGVRVAQGDVNGDGTNDIICAAGPGGAPRVVVYDGRTFAIIRDFLAYASGFTGGVYVTSADTNGDGFDEIITGVGVGGGPHVRVFDGVTGNERYGFFAYAPQFLSGVNVAAGDLDGDGKAEIITGAGPGGGPHVRVWNSESAVERFGFFAYSTAFLGGVNVAAADLTGDGKAEIITGPGIGGGPHVRVFSPTGAALQSFFAYGPGFLGGVRVAAEDVDGDGRADIVTGAGPSGGPHVRAFRGIDGVPLRSFFAFDTTFLGGIWVG